MTTPTILKQPAVNGNRPAGKWDEEGTPGLEAYAGFVQKAYQTDLYWPSVYPIYNRLRRADPEMAIVREIYTAVTSGVTLEWEPPEDPTPDEQEATDFANECLDDLEGGIGRLAQTYVTHVPFMGFGWWEIVPGLRRKGWRPPQDDPWRSSFDDGMTGIRRLAWRDHSSFARWDLDEQTGRVKAFIQVDPPHPERALPREKALHITRGDPNNPEGLAGLEPVYRLERIKFGLEVVQGIGFEHSAGHLSVTIEEGEPNKVLIQQAARAILTAQPGNFAAWPAGTTGTIIDVPFSAAPALLEAIRYYGILKLAVFNMQHIAMATLSENGSFAAMKDSSAMWLVAYNSMMADFAQQVNDQVGPWLFSRNIATWPNLERQPRFVARPLDKIVDLTELGTFGTAWKAIEGLGQDDLLALRRKSGILPEVLAADQDGDVVEPEPEPDNDEDEAEEDLDGEGEDEDAADDQAEADAEADMAQQAERTDELVRLAAGPALPRRVSLGRDFAQLARGYSALSDGYWNTVRSQVADYLIHGQRVKPYADAVRAEMASSFTTAFEMAYREGGGEEIDREDSAWLRDRVAQERSHIASLFASLKAWRRKRLREGPINVSELIDVATERASGYVDSLDAVFSEGRLRGARNVMLTFAGTDGKQPCKTCRSLRGKRRSAKWWVAQGLVPGAGNENYECIGFNCQHRLADDKNNRWTL